jgi:hypothetical protein
MADFRVFLATQDAPIDNEPEEVAHDELVALSNYENLIGYFFYTDSEEEARDIVAQAKEIYARVGWSPDSVYVQLT